MNCWVYLVPSCIEPAVTSPSCAVSLLLWKCNAFPDNQRDYKHKMYNSTELFHIIMFIQVYIFCTMYILYVKVWFNNLHMACIYVHLYCCHCQCQTIITMCIFIIQCIIVYTCVCVCKKMYTRFDFVYFTLSLSVSDYMYILLQC